MRCSHLFRILNRTPLGVLVPQVNQLLLLTGPQPTNTFLVDLDDPEGEVLLGKHYDLVLLGAAFVLDVAEGEQVGLALQDGGPPSRVGFVGDHVLLVDGGDGLVEEIVVALLLVVGEIILEQKNDKNA